VVFIGDFLAVLGAAIMSHSVRACLTIFDIDFGANTPILNLDEFSSGTL
jgi:hypothetical protein